MLKMKDGKPLDKPDKPDKAAKESKAESPANSASDLQDVLAAIHKSKGAHVAVSGLHVPSIERQRTGLFEFDYYTGGGFPKGRYSIVFGPESSMKTTLLLMAIAEAQRQPPPCNKGVLVDLERCFDPVHAARLGVDVEKLIVVQPSYGEEAVDLIDALVRARDVAVLGVDSMAAMVASKEIGQSAESFDVGTSALLNKRLVNKLMYAFGEEARYGHRPCVILINQIRYKIGVMFGDPETMPGGEAIKFLASLRVRLYGKNEILKHVDPNRPAFKEVKCVVKKAKVPVRSVDFSYKQCLVEHDGLRMGETNSWTMVSSHLREMGSLAKGKATWDVVGKSWPTLAAIEVEYQQNHALRSQLQTMVIDGAKDQFMFVEEASNASAQVEPGIKMMFGDVR